MQATTPSRTDIRVAQYHALTDAITAIGGIADALDDAGLYTDATQVQQARTQLYATQAKVAMLLSRTGDLDKVGDR